MLLSLHINITKSFSAIQEPCSKKVICINIVNFITSHVSVCGLGWFVLWFLTSTYFSVLVLGFQRDSHNFYCILSILTNKILS